MLKQGARFPSHQKCPHNISEVCPARAHVKYCPPAQTYAAAAGYYTYSASDSILLFDPSLWNGPGSLPLSRHKLPESAVASNEDITQAVITMAENKPWAFTPGSGNCCCAGSEGCNRYHTRTCRARRGRRPLIASCVVKGRPGNDKLP